MTMLKLRSRINPDRIIGEAVNTYRLSCPHCEGKMNYFEGVCENEVGELQVYSRWVCEHCHNVIEEKVLMPIPTDWFY